MQRGAAEIARRHRLPMHLALAVADRRMSLDEALARRRRGPRPPAATREPTASPRPRISPVVPLAVALLLLASAAVGYAGWQRWRGEVRDAHQVAALGAAIHAAPAQQADTPTGIPSAPRPPADVRRDHKGHLTRVRGASPSAVLVAYCEAASEIGEVQPLEIASALPAQARARYGLFRDLSRDGDVYAVRIRQDRKTGRWSVGDGRRAIEPRLAERVRLGQNRAAVALEVAGR